MKKEAKSSNKLWINGDIIGMKIFSFYFGFLCPAFGKKQIIDFPFDY